jgi:hypothetical protein
MKFAYFAFLSVVCCACSHNIRDYGPSHVGISPSMEWEVMEGQNVKYKPRIGSSIDWNF